MPEALPPRQFNHHMRVAFGRSLAVSALVWFCLSGCGATGTTPPLPSAQGSDVATETPTDDQPITPSSTTNKPAISFTIAPVYCCNPRSMKFEAQVDASASLGDIDFQWSFGDGRTGTGPSIEHTYSWPGKYLVTLRADFPDNATQSASQELTLAGEHTPNDETDTPHDDDVAGPMPPDDPVVDAGDVPSDDESDDADNPDDPDADEPEGNPDVVNQEAIAQVTAGLTDTADASWWGFDPADATQSIQSAINSGARKVIVPNMGFDWVVRPLFLVSNQEIIFENGVVLTAKSGAFHGVHDCLLSGVHITNVKLLGTNATLRMRKTDYTGPQYSVSEWRHVLSLEGVNNFEASGLSFQSSGGDGLIIAHGKDAQHPSSRSVLIRNCDFYNNYRQGISVLSAENLTIDNCTIRGTIGTAPQAAIDLEPDDPTDVLINVQITNCNAIGNAGSGFMANLVQMTTTRPMSVTVSNLHVQGSRQTAMRVLVTKNGPPSGFIHFENCVAEGTEYSGLGIKWNLSTAFDVTFDRCEWRNNARFPEDFPIVMEFMGSPTTAPPGNIHFTDCLVNDQKLRNTIQVADDQVLSGSPDVTGTIFVTNPMIDAPIPEMGWPLPDLDVQMLNPP